MSKSRLKFLVFLGGAAVLFPLTLVVFSLISQFVTEFQRGAVPVSIFHGHQLIIPESEQAQWVTDTADYTGFKPSQSEHEEIISTYWEAWEAQARACLTGDTSALATYWAGGAYTQMIAAAHACPKNAIFVHKFHHLRLTFFSDDGSVVTFSDENFDYSYTVSGTTDDLRANALITMTLDTGVWRIRQIELTLH